jgi:hypothetical protein
MTDEPTFDVDGYPSEQSLTAISVWQIKSNEDIQALLDYCQTLWAYYGRWEDKPLDPEEGPMIWVATGGWSGNESIIKALEENWIFWCLCWQMSRRGGYHEFRTRPMKETQQETTE